MTTKKHALPTALAVSFSFLAPQVSLAAAEDAQASGSVSLSSKDGASAEGDASGKKKKKKKDKASKGKKKKEGKWIHRWPPQAGLWELGIYGGIYVPGRNHELFEPDLSLPDQGFQRFGSVAPDFGLRAAFYPLRFLGIELEGGLMPTNAGGESAILYTFRGHLLAQIARWSIAPFLLIGPGMLGVSSDRSAVGNDIDPSLHFGGGVKFFLSRRAMLRFDIRDVVSHKRGVDVAFRGHNLEVLLGLSLVLGRKDKDEPPPEEPKKPKDSDGDGFVDSEDACPNEPGVEPDGCPIRDRDGDGILDEDDQCPDEAGVEPDGCPIRDTDGDGIMDPDDKCVDEPETKNGYEDADGCPDEIPEEVKKFTGVIKGIYFDTAKATIKSKSKKTLDRAVKTLTDFPSVRVEISGHTDSRGKRDYNMNLSRERAESVKAYLVNAGVDSSRITTRGAGPDEPIADNKTKSGRAQNRRIEFRLLTQ